MFDQLPETYPSRNKKRPRAFAAAVVLQTVLVSALIIAQMAMPAKLGEFHVLTTLYMAPPPPPPPPPAPAEPPPRVREPRPETPRNTGISQQAVVVPEVRMPQQPTVQQPELVAPTEIPRDVARIMEVGPVGGVGAIAGLPGGVPGGIPGGVSGGALGGVLGGVANAAPPPPPKEPVRVGGDVKQPRIIKIVEPKYPATAKTARVEGSVIIEATLTADGSVDKLKVISGPPLLIPAAVDAVQQWRYEPTYLNGQAVPVILTAKVNFSLANSR
jgi:protein TonB